MKQLRSLVILVGICYFLNVQGMKDFVIEMEKGKDNVELNDNNLTDKLLVMSQGEQNANNDAGQKNQLTRNTNLSNKQAEDDDNKCWICYEPLDDEKYDTSLNEKIFKEKKRAEKLKSGKRTFTETEIEAKFTIAKKGHKLHDKFHAVCMKANMTYNGKVCIMCRNDIVENRTIREIVKLKCQKIVGDCKSCLNRVCSPLKLYYFLDRIVKMGISLNSSALHSLMLLYSDVVIQHGFLEHGSNGWKKILRASCSLITLVTASSMLVYAPPNDPVIDIYRSRESGGEFSEVSTFGCFVATISLLSYVGANLTDTMPNLSLYRRRICVACSIVSILNTINYPLESCIILNVFNVISSGLMDWIPGKFMIGVESMMLVMGYMLLMPQMSINGDETDSTALKQLIVYILEFLRIVSYWNTRN